MKTDTTKRAGKSRDVARVELRLTGDRLDPAEVTKVTGLLPSRSWTKGATYESKAGVRARPHGIWAVTSETSDIEQSALELLAIVEPQAHAIREVACAAGTTISVGIHWLPEAAQGGFTVSSDVMRRLSELSERIDVYFSG